MKEDDFGHHGFETIRIVDNFYQTSSFFPMPIVAIATMTEDGKTNVGPYSLCFPYYVAGRDYYAMILETRNNSNTARNLLMTKMCSLNFLPDNKKYMDQCVEMGFPGESMEEKMKGCIFTLSEGLRKKEDPDGNYPRIVNEAFQVFECTWDSNLDGAENDKVQDEYDPPYHDFNGITSKMGAHFILKVENILLKRKYKGAIINGMKSNCLSQKIQWPSIPIHYGFRDSMGFWISRFKTPKSYELPRKKGTDLQTVRYAANRIDADIQFTDEACARLLNVPRIFLQTALKGCILWAKENGVTTITSEHIDMIRAKRSAERK